jgi:hypothetical protein
MTKIVVVEEINRNEWRTLLENSSTSSYFQSPECYDFYKTLTFLEPFGYAVCSDRKIKALVCGYIIANGGSIKQYLSRRAIVNGGLLLANDIVDGEILELLETLRTNLKDRIIYLEIRNNNNYARYKHLFNRQGFLYEEHLNYIINTSISIGRIRECYSESKNRQLHKAQEQGVVCLLSTQQNDIDAFYKILSDLYRKKIQKPLFPKEFFDNFVNSPNSHLFVVKKEKTVIGGIACVSLMNKILYEWFVCGDTVNFNHLYPSVVATDSAIEFACNKGFEYFDFMGAGNPNKNYGVRDFKSRFGGQLVEYGRFMYIADNMLYRLGKTIINNRLMRFLRQKEYAIIKKNQ